VRRGQPDFLCHRGELNSIPRLALAPLLIIWFGIDMMSYNITGAMTVILIIMVLMTLLNEVMNRMEAKVLRWRSTSQAVAEPKELR
jgi:ABC-type nitrate/sulfonate/bicarbonate transport system permease component